MTCAAPKVRTSSTLRVLDTPVTSAPNALAIWTANVPTPPDAPVISTACPGSEWVEGARWKDKFVAQVKSKLG